MTSGDRYPLAMDDASSYLAFIHVHPLPEDEDAVRLERAMHIVATELLPGFDIEVTSAWVSTFEVISLGDLDLLPTTT